MSKFFITQKSGYTYSFNDYRKVILEVSKGNPELIELEVQYEPKRHFRRIGLLAQTILMTNVKEIKDYISDINVRRARSKDI